MRTLAPALALCIILAGCDQPPSVNMVDNVGNAANGLDNDMAANHADNAAEPVRSILRPDVVEPEMPKIEPLDAVIAFGASGLALDDGARAAIDALIEAPAMQAGGPITLRGHSDSRGSDGDNRVASRIRAEAVAAYLGEKGIAKDRITLVALGEARPIAPNAKEDGSDDPEGRAKNRRVDVHIALPAVIVPSPAILPTISPVDGKEKK